MREADDQAIANATKYVDTRHGMEGCGDLVQSVATGAMSWDDVVADLYELCAQTTGGRRSRDEITLFKNVGGGHLDLFTAQYLLAGMSEK